MKTRSGRKVKPGSPADQGPAASPPRPASDDDSSSDDEAPEAISGTVARERVLELEKAQRKAAQKPQKKRKRVRGGDDDAGAGGGAGAAGGASGDGDDDEVDDALIQAALEEQKAAEEARIAKMKARRARKRRRGAKRKKQPQVDPSGALAVHKEGFELRLAKDLGAHRTRTQAQTVAEFTRNHFFGSHRNRVRASISEAAGVGKRRTAGRVQPALFATGLV